MPNKHNSQNPSKVKFILIFLGILAAATILNSIIPPLQSPDEGAHLRRAYILSKGHLLLDSNPRGSGGDIDDGLTKFIDLYQTMLSTDVKINDSLLDTSKDLHWEGVEHRQATAGTGYYFPAIYAPQAIALTVGRLFNLSLDASYELARIFAFVTCIALLIVAFAIVAPNALVCALLFMPMVVFQAISAAIDGLALALTVLAISCFLKLSRSPGTDRMRVSLLIGLHLSIFIVASSRAQALPLLLLPLVLALVKRDKQIFFYAIFTCIATILWTAIALKITVDPRIPRTLSTPGIIEFYLFHPGHFLSIFWNSISQYWLFYGSSFIGILGSLNVLLPKEYLELTSCILALIAVFSVAQLRVLRNEYLARSALAVAACISIFLVFFALLVTWTQFPSQTIEGVQGRYFHIPLVLLAYAIGSSDQKIRHWKTYLVGALLTIFLLVSLNVTSTALLRRYWANDNSYRLPAPKGSASIPLSIGAHDALTGVFKVPRDGKLTAIAINIGTYAGQADGMLSVEVCSTKCVLSVQSVQSANDNAFFRLPFALPLPTVAGTDLRFKITVDTAHAPAIWARRSTDATNSIRVGDAISNLIPDMKFFIE